MLKWTASAQKLPQDTPVSSHTFTNTAVATMRTPRLADAKRRKRRATTANKENIPILTSTPMVNITRNSPLVLAPLVDILNITPEPVTDRTSNRRRVSLNVFNEVNTSTNRRHSSVGFTIPQIPQYAATLPKYEEEYSPSTILPTGQQLALRGLLPDPFMDNPRYFTTPKVTLDQGQEVKTISALPKKRKLEQEFVAIAKEEGDILEESCLPANNKKILNNTGLTSNKMGDQTLDNLIDAILDSARKEEKKKKPRKSFNLRRRTLLKNQVDQQPDLVLSPSYAAGDDPCSDLSFLNCEPFNFNSKESFKVTTPKPASPIPTYTPEPATPLPATAALPQHVLLQLPTPPKRHDSFSLDTPVRPKLKRRSESNARPNSSAKKYKVDSRNYFEIGVALPSIYV